MLNHVGYFCWWNTGIPETLCKFFFEIIWRQVTCIRPSQSIRIIRLLKGEHIRYRTFWHSGFFQRSLDIVQGFLIYRNRLRSRSIMTLYLCLVIGNFQILCLP